MQTGTSMTMPSPTHEPAAAVYARGLELARRADELGFSHVRLAEHHFTNYAYRARPLLLVSHIAAQTRRIRRSLGCDYFSASFWFGGLSHARVLESMRLFARDVLPAFAAQAPIAEPMEVLP